MEAPLHQGRIYSNVQITTPLAGASNANHAMELFRGNIGSMNTLGMGLSTDNPYTLASIGFSCPDPNFGSGSATYTAGNTTISPIPISNCTIDSSFSLDVYANNTQIMGLGIHCSGVTSLIGQTDT